MYRIDKDKVVPLNSIPDMDGGAPNPEVMVADQRLRITYRTGSGSRVVLEFLNARIHVFGWPNDEVLDAHPLYHRGLGYYGAFEVLDSSWLREMVEGNRRHRHHKDELFLGLRHFIITFHDETFECIASSYEVIDPGADD